MLKIKGLVQKIKYLTLGQWGEAFIYLVILVNTVVIYMQVKGYDSYALNLIDALCTIIFVLEMMIKLHQFNILRLFPTFLPSSLANTQYSFWSLAKLSRKVYWKDRWNRLDATLVVLSLPSLLMFFFPDSVSKFAGSLSFVLAMRLLRITRLFKSARFFGAETMDNMISGLKRAMKMSRSIIGTFVLVIFIFGLINCSLFKDFAPSYFDTPMISIYSVFRLFTIEGWYDIPDAIIQGTIAKGTFFPGLDDIIRVYFCALLITGGIFGMSFINSVFVDAMAENNNDEILESLKELKRQNEELHQKVDELNNQLKS